MRKGWRFWIKKYYICERLIAKRKLLHFCLCGSNSCSFSSDTEKNRDLIKKGWRFRSKKYYIREGDADLQSGGAPPWP